MPSPNFIVVDDHGGLAGCEGHIIESLKRKRQDDYVVQEEKECERQKQPE